MDKHISKKDLPARLGLSEDWLSVLIAFLLILLTVLGIIGSHGIKITF